jgi:glutaredoxin
VSDGLLKVGGAVGLAFVVLLMWTNKRETERHDPRRNNPDNSVVLLSATWCGYCEQEKQGLLAANVPFRELDVETSEEGEDAYRAVGGHGIPVTVIGKDVVFGFDAERLNTLLRERGYQVNL